MENEDVSETPVPSGSEGKTTVEPIKDKNGSPEWFVYDMDNHEIVNHMANGAMAEAWAKLTAKSTGNKIIVGMIYQKVEA